MRYADDWICTANSREVLEQKVLPEITRFLEERGLELSTEKTRITYIDDGFDFLGFNLRKYKDKLLIKPSKQGLKVFLVKIRKVIHIKQANSANELIQALNPKIQGWVNYYRHSVAKQTFSYVDTSIFKALWKWSRRKHPNKSTKWVKNKYFTRSRLRDWLFFTRVAKENLFLKVAATTRIIRHVKVKAAATPYDPAFKEYFLHRAIKRQQMNSRAKINWP